MMATESGRLLVMVLTDSSGRSEPQPFLVPAGGNPNEPVSQVEVRTKSGVAVRADVRDAPSLSVPFEAPCAALAPRNLEFGAPLFLGGGKCQGAPKPAADHAE